MWMWEKSVQAGPRVPWYMCICGGQETTVANQFSPFTIGFREWTQVSSLYREHSNLLSPCAGQRLDFCSCFWFCFGGAQWYSPQSHFFLDFSNCLNYPHCSPQEQDVLQITSLSLALKKSLFRVYFLGLFLTLTVLGWVPWDTNCTVKTFQNVCGEPSKEKYVWRNKGSLVGQMENFNCDFVSAGPSQHHGGSEAEWLSEPSKLRQRE